jgi:folate-binding protein YgfZ
VTLSPPVLHLDDHPGLVVVSGADTWSFLQSLVSQDLDPLRDGEGAHSLLLAPQGRLVADFRVLRLDPLNAWLDTAPRVGAVLREGLARFAIRVDVAIDDASEHTARARLRGAGAVDLAVEALGVGVPETQHAHVADGAARVVRADWDGVEGVDVVGPRERVERAWRLLAEHGAHDDPGLLEALRVECGIPLQGAELDDRTIPQEAYLERDAVSFTKGCFVGQELVCRIDSRGSTVPRYLRRLSMEGSAVPPPGALLEVEGTPAGVVTSSARRQDGRPIALAMVPRAIEPPREAEVRWETGHARARIEAR